jgi:hypothetical protein
MRSRGSSSWRTGLRAKGGFFALARAGAGVREGALAGVLRAESLARSEGAVLTGEERIGNARAEVFAALEVASVALAVGASDFFAGVWACARAGAAFAEPAVLPVRLTPDAIDVDRAAGAATPPIPGRLQVPSLRGGRSLGDNRLS